MGLSSAALNQIKLIVREEVRAELERVAPDFLATARRGTEMIESIYQTVIDFDNEVGGFSCTLKLHQKSLEVLARDVDDLRSIVGPGPSGGRPSGPSTTAPPKNQ
jgi:hypothetical protein